MSKVKIQGNASGTGVVTLTAPNTNTDRTITLPDGDITLGGGADTSLSNLSATGENKVCQAWVSWNGTGTISIIDSFNVSSITDLDTGLWQPNFTNAMVNATYTCFVGQMNNAVDNQCSNTAYSRTTSKVEIGHFEGNLRRDLALMDVLVFGD